MYTSFDIKNRTKSVRVLERMVWRAITNQPQFDQLDTAQVVNLMVKVDVMVRDVVQHRRRNKHLKTTCCDIIHCALYDDGYLTHLCVG